MLTFVKEQTAVYDIIKITNDKAKEQSSLFPLWTRMSYSPYILNRFSNTAHSTISYTVMQMGES